jgi:hypothetical protein
VASGGVLRGAVLVWRTKVPSATGLPCRYGSHLSLLPNVNQGTDMSDALDALAGLDPFTEMSGNDLFLLCQHAFAQQERAREKHGDSVIVSMDCTPGSANWGAVTTHRSFAATRMSYRPIAPAIRRISRARSSLRGGRPSCSRRTSSRSSSSSGDSEGESEPPGYRRSTFLRRGGRPHVARIACQAVIA